MAENSVGSSDDRHHQPIIIGPDPSSLTTAQLQREIAHLSDRIDLKIEGVVSAIGARLDAIDKATSVFHDNLTRVPTEVQEAVANLRLLHEEKFESVKIQFEERDVRVDASARDTKLAVDAALQAAKEAVGNNQRLHDEKFHSIEKQFTERDVRTEQTSRDSKVAVDAALQAAKEAVAEQNRSSALAIAKSETATAKSIDQLGLTVATMTKGLEDKIDDLKQRLTRIEGQSLGQSVQKAEGSTSIGLIISIIAVLLTVVGLAAAFISRLPAR